LRLSSDTGTGVRIVLVPSDIIHDLGRIGQILIGIPLVSSPAAHLPVFHERSVYKRITRPALLPDLFEPFRPKYQENLNKICHSANAVHNNYSRHLLQQKTFDKILEITNTGNYMVSQQNNWKNFLRPLFCRLLPNFAILRPPRVFPAMDNFSGPLSD
jgi:hypothetical protein